MSLDRLEAFKRTAIPGDRFAYFTGMVTVENCLKLEPVLDSAWRGYAGGEFDLVQRRVGPNRFEHLIVRRKYRADLRTGDLERFGYSAASLRRELAY